jgi:hypothetical protein
VEDDAPLPVWSEAVQVADEVPVMLQELPDAVTETDEKDVARHVPHPNIASRSNLLPLT